MDDYNQKEILYVNDTIKTLCDIMDKVLKSGNINTIESKQKLCAISSFLEFLKAGADVTTETLENNMLAFIINMK